METLNPFMHQLTSVFFRDNISSLLLEFSDDPSLLLDLLLGLFHSFTRTISRNTAACHNVSHISYSRLTHHWPSQELQCVAVALSSLSALPPTLAVVLPCSIIEVEGAVVTQFTEIVSP